MSQDYKNFNTTIKFNKEVKQIIDNQIYFQHRLWNWLVEVYNPINQELKKQKKGKTKFSVIEKSIKENFPECRELWNGSRVWRGAIQLFNRTWDRTMKVPGAQPPNFEKWNKMEMHLYIPDIDGELHGTLFRPHCLLHWSKRAATIQDKTLHSIISSLNGKIKQYTIIRRNGKYNIVFTVEYNSATIEKTISKDGQLGLDWGIISFLTDDKGNTYNFPDSLFKLDNRIRRLRRVLTGKTIDSKNYMKILKKMNKVYAKQNRIKLDWIEKTTTNMLRQNSLICLEKLDLVDLRSKVSKKSRHLMNLFPYGHFCERLIAKSKNYTCEVFWISPQELPSTQICCRCGVQKQRSLSERFIECECGNKINRDQNAAINLLNYGKLKLLERKVGAQCEKH